MDNAWATEGWFRALFGSSVLKVAQASSGFAISIILARALGPAGYGAYSFIIALAGILAMPVQFGLPSLLIREVARYRSLEKWGHLRGILFATDVGVVLFAVMISMILGLFAWLSPPDVQAYDIRNLWLVLPIILLFALSRLRQGALAGLQLVVLAQLPDRFINRIVLLALICVAYFNNALSPRNAIILFIVAVSTEFIFSSIFLRRHLPHEVRQHAPAFHLKSWLFSMLPLGLISSTQILNAYTDLVMLGLLSKPADVGGYRVASLLAWQIIVGHILATSIFAPRFARLYVEGNLIMIQQFTTRCAQISFFMALPVFCVYLFFGSTILDLIFGPTYEVAYQPLIILSIAQLFVATIGPLQSVLNMSGHERDVFGAVVVTLVVNILLNALLIPSFGMSGAACATAISLVLLTLVLIVRVNSRLGVWSGPLTIKARKTT